MTDVETHTTEMTILPDGRVFVFGASREIMETLAEIECGDDELIKRLQWVREDETTRRIENGRRARDGP